MIAQVVIENGQKKIIPLTADAGAGNPVGTIIPMYKKSSPSGYLYCDGSTFDETAYPLLYAYLGTNVLPDYREFVLVGAEENTTDVYNASTNPNGTIHSHDVYTEGQAKDDQLQTHSHQYKIGRTQVVQSGLDYGVNDWGFDIYNTSEINTGRAGDVTRGKRKAVYFYIKATSGLSENAQDNVINTLNEQRSYSTEEHPTGQKYNGKDVYSKTIYVNNMADFPISTGITNVDEVLKMTTTGKDFSNYYNIPYYTISVGTAYYCSVYFHPDDGTLRYEGNMQTQKIICTLEYTKTN